MLGSGSCARKRGYHHGALRDALVEAARRLVAEKGPGGFTLLDAARLCGVSPAAPYRHFRDLDALLDEVAGRGFAEFAARLEAAARAAPAKDAVLPALGGAYLAFAREEPGYYGAMFGRRPAPGVAAPPPGDGGAFGTLVKGVEAAGVPQGVDTRLVALHIWALSHGVATLLANSAADWGLRPEAVLESGVSSYLRGLRASAAAEA
jgi:AcrR family transcriptional regulator